MAGAEALSDVRNLVSRWEPGFLTDGCSKAFIYYSSVEMMVPKKASAMEIIVQRTVVLIECGTESLKRGFTNAARNREI